jgi:phosphate transport system substrate-binding protein
MSCHKRLRSLLVVIATSFAVSLLTKTTNASGFEQHINPAFEKKTTVYIAGELISESMYWRWIVEYNQRNSAVKFIDNGIGIRTGVFQFLNQTVDLAAFARPLNQAELKSYPIERGQPVQIPMTGQMVGLAYNLPGVRTLRLSRSAYCGIAEGTIKRWNDPKIVSTNPKVKLPNLPLTFVYQIDVSYVGYLSASSWFAKHLEQACSNWRIGADGLITWKQGIGVIGELGVTAQIQELPGTIGYLPLPYIIENELSNELSIAALENKAGRFVLPSAKTGAAAFQQLASIEEAWILIADPTQPDAYPIVGLSYWLLYEKYPNSAKATALKDLIRWALIDGKIYAEEMGYIALPDNLTTKVLQTVETIK